MYIQHVDRRTQEKLGIRFDQANVTTAMDLIYGWFLDGTIDGKEWDRILSDIESELRRVWRQPVKRV